MFLHSKWIRFQRPRFRLASIVVIVFWLNCTSCSVLFKKVEAAASSDKRSDSVRLAQYPPLLQTSVLSQRAFEIAKSIFEQADVVHYEHREVPASEQILQDPNGGLEAKTDCSGFISYVVRAVGVRHYKAVHEMQPNAPYPQAKTWAHFFAGLSSNRTMDGWTAPTRFQDLLPGDIIAWVKESNAEDHAGHGNTGHVMMVAETPGQPQTEVVEGALLRFVSVRVIDSSSVYHFTPEALPPNAHQNHRDGLGIGYVRIVLSDADEPIGYWEGTYWGEGDKPVEGPKLSPYVRFGRMVSLLN